MVLFDDRMETLVPSTLATDKTTLLEKLRHVHSRGAPNLHAGWVEGGMQVSQSLNPDQLNRVIVLSDGLANEGETRLDAIATDVHGLAQRGVSTSTLGMGDDYSEDLLTALTRSGDGNFTMASMAPSPMLMEEQQILEELEADYRQGNLSRARKKAFSESFNLSRRGHSRPRRSMDS